MTIIREGFREYLDDLISSGYSVRHDEHGSDPDLIGPDGDPIESWREGYPYAERMSRDAYEEQKYQLQIELLKFQYWIGETGQKHVILFEGRDAAGKGGTIKRFMEHLNPRSARVVALTKPTTTELGQWYFQRYVNHLPTAGDLVLFDRSWYNRAGVERVMGFCSPAEYELFLRHAPLFESMLAESGVHLTKFWFSVTRQEQRTRFAIRQVDPVRRWKLSPMDIESLDRWEAYTEAKEAMLTATDTDVAPWTTIKSNDKKAARINAMRFFLNQFDVRGQGHLGRLPGRPAPGQARARDDRRLARFSAAASSVASGAGRAQGPAPRNHPPGRAVSLGARVTHARPGSRQTHPRSAPCPRARPSPSRPGGRVSALVADGGRTPGSAVGSAGRFPRFALVRLVLSAREGCGRLRVTAPVR